LAEIIQVYLSILYRIIVIIDYNHAVTHAYYKDVHILNPVSKKTLPNVFYCIKVV